RRLSGDQENGSPVARAALLTTATGPDPSAFATTIDGTDPVVRYASRMPSGEKVSSSAPSGSEVSVRGFDPSAAVALRLLPSTKAIEPLAAAPKWGNRRCPTPARSNTAAARTRIATMTNVQARRVIGARRALNVNCTGSHLSRLDHAGRCRLLIVRARIAFR